MPHDPRKLLHDIMSRVEAIQQFTQGKDLAEYQADAMLRAAVERLFGIIGEAVSRLLKSDAALAARLTDYRKLIDFCKSITYSVGVVDDQPVWDAVTNKLPTL